MATTITIGAGLPPIIPTTVLAIMPPAPVLSMALAKGSIPAKRKMVVQSTPLYACFSERQPVKTQAKAPITEDTCIGTLICFSKTMARTTPHRIPAQTIIFLLLPGASEVLSLATVSTLSCGQSLLPMVIMYSMPIRERGMPIQANSKKPKGVIPLFSRVALISILGGVPIKVIVPPTLAATARDISWEEADSLAAAQICTTTGKRQATVAVLDDTADNTTVTNTKANIKRFSPVPAALTTVTPIF